MTPCSLLSASVHCAGRLLFFPDDGSVTSDLVPMFSAQAVDVQNVTSDLVSMFSVQTVDVQNVTQNADNSRYVTGVVFILRSALRVPEREDASLRRVLCEECERR